MFRKVIIAISILLFSISAYAQISLTDHISGVEGDVLKNVAARLKVHRESAKKPLTTAAATRLYQQGSREINEALKPFGYFRAQIRARLTKRGRSWTASYHIKLGKPIRITQLNVRITGAGRDDKPFQYLLAHFPLEQGQQFSAVKYELAKQELLTIANKRGYFKARMIKSEVRINLISYQTTITLYFYTGPRYRFGQVNFSSVPFKARFLRRYLTFKRGEYYNENRLQTLQENLVNSNYFSQVIVTPETDKLSGGEVPIMVKLKVVKAQQYRFGGGYGTDTGFRGLIGVVFPRLTKDGQYFSATANVAQLQSQFQASYTIPGTNPATDKYNINSSYLEQNLASGESETLQLGFNYVTQVKRWQQTLGIKVLHEFSRPDGRPSLTATMLIPNAQWLYTSAKNPIKVKKGTRISFMLQGATSAILSNTNFAQAEVQMKRIQPITRYQRLVLRGTLGATLINNINDLPYTLQFYTGGASSVRGYRYNDIGPGKYLVVGSIELQQKVYKNWYLTAFYDAGNASNQLFQHYKQGIGVGIMWQSPVGAIEVTVAEAVNKPGNPLMVQLSMGPEL